MGDLALKEIKIEAAKKLDSTKYNITLKRDGALMYYIDGDLISPRGVNRNIRFPHIKKILDDNHFPNCMGEMFIPGGNVFNVSSSENWDKAFFMPFDLLNKTMPYKDRYEMVNAKVAELNNPKTLSPESEWKPDLITPLMIFNTIEEGWAYVKASNGEGLVLRNSNEWLKVKILLEFKIPIKQWEAGSDKGTFVLNDAAGSRISGTSVGFVKQFLEIQNTGEVAMAEVEAPFVTESGKLFQPRLRRIFIQEVKEEGLDGVTGIENVDNNNKGRNAGGITPSD